MEARSDANESPTPGMKITVTAICWLAGILGYWCLINRGGWPFYLSIHEWMTAQGIPKSIRNLDSLFFYCVPTLVVAKWIIPPGHVSTLSKLCLRGGQHGWFMVGVIACSPMVVGGAIIGVMKTTGQAISLPTIFNGVVSGAIRAPLGEEFLMRGLLVALPATVLVWRSRPFWINAIAAGLFFGLMHCESWWPIAGIMRDWPNLLVTFVGAMWYAWLLAHWQSLWLPIILHSGMNLGWFLASASGGAGGGGTTINVLRVVTIALGTYLTLRMIRERRSADQQNSEATAT
ncbi:MAG: lysostaphin resistance A-like protein [Phycisphaerae bacterium]